MRGRGAALAALAITAAALGVSCDAYELTAPSAPRERFVGHKRGGYGAAQFAGLGRGRPTPPRRRLRNPKHAKRRARHARAA